MDCSIVPLVEGLSEVESVPILFRRILSSLGVYNISIAKPFRVKRNRVVLEGELEKAIIQAIRSRDNVKGVFVLLDADDDCPAALSRTLLERGRKTTDLPVAVVLAKKEFEGWFLGAKESLRGKRGIRNDASPPAMPEDIRGAKERLSANMDGKRYLEIIDQPALAQEMDPELAAKRCPSFRKFHEEAVSMIRGLQ